MHVYFSFREIPAHSLEDDGADITSESIDFDNEEEMVSGLTCIGIVGIQDPVRPEVSAESGVFRGFNGGP